MTIKTNTFYRGDIIAPLPTLLLYHKKDCHFRVGISFLHYSWCLDFMQDDPEPEVTVSPEEQERIRKMMEQTVKPVVTAAVDSSRFEAAIKQAQFPSGGVVPKEKDVFWDIIGKDTTAKDLQRRLIETGSDATLHITEGDGGKTLMSVDRRHMRMHYITSNFTEDTCFMVYSVATCEFHPKYKSFKIGAVGLGR